MKTSKKSKSRSKKVKKSTCAGCAAAKKSLLELLRITTKNEDGEVPLFSESGSYSLFGKDKARTVRHHLECLGKALGVRDIDFIDNEEVASDYRTTAWDLLRSLSDAQSSAKELDFCVRMLEQSKDFVENVMRAKQEVEVGLSKCSFLSPESAIKKIQNALNTDDHGRIRPSWLDLSSK